LKSWVVAECVVYKAEETRVGGELLKSGGNRRLV